MPNDVSAILSLPYILPAQAQKHVTHNEAVRMLDLLVQLVVTSRQVTTPDPDPAENARYIVPTGATGAFAGQSGRIAVWESGSWAFFDALPGWQAEVLDEGFQVVFDGLTWLGPDARAQRFLRVGIAAAADATNRLTVAAPATLLTHDGAGHQMKINKAAATDTASLLFQTDFSGRAEMGTTGSDAFEIKTSADGTTFATALRAVPATGRVELPAGLASAAGTVALPGQSFLGDNDTGLFNPAANHIGFSAGGTQRALLTPTALTLSVPVSGSAITQSATDITAGRLVKTGDFGLGRAISLNSGENLNDILTTGSYFCTTPDLAKNFPIQGAGSLVVVAIGSTTVTQRYSAYGNVSSLAIHVRIFERTWGNAGFTPWVEMFHRASILGAVSQSDGIPTGRVIERNANGNGEFVRFADGTQICTQVLSASSGAAAIWTFPAAFAAAPVVTGAAQANVLSCVVLDAAPTTSACTFSARDKADARRGDTVRIRATGRWF